MNAESHKPRSSNKSENTKCFFTFLIKPCCHQFFYHNKNTFQNDPSQLEYSSSLLESMVGKGCLPHRTLTSCQASRMGHKHIKCSKAIFSARQYIHCIKRQERYSAHEYQRAKMIFSSTLTLWPWELCTSWIPVIRPITHLHRLVFQAS